MKFRLKGSAFVAPHLIEFESNRVSVFELKSKVGNLLQLEENTWRALQLSMNGKSAIAAEDSQIVTTLGFVSGDTVYILGLPPGVQAPQQQNVIRQEPKPPVTQEVPSKSTADTDKLHEDESPTKRKEDGRMFLGTLNLKQGDLPDLHSKLIATNPDKLTSPFEKFCGLLHLLMIEGGFKPSTTEEGINPCTTLPDSWNVKHDTLMLNYVSSYPPHSNCTIIITVMGPLTLVHGQSSIEKTKFTWKTKIADYLSPQLQNLNKLSLEFKNHIVYPLFLAVQRESHGVCPVNFSNLPPELSFLILSFLDARSLCRLASTSHQFKLLADHPRLWQKLLKRDFRVTQSVDTSACKMIYRDEYREAQRRKNRSSLQRPFPSRPDFGIGFPQPPFPHPGVGNFPGIVGGYQDIYPDLSGLEPRRQRFPFGPNRNLRGHFPPPGGGGFSFF